MRTEKERPGELDLDGDGKPDRVTWQVVSLVLGLALVVVLPGTFLLYKGSLQFGDVESLALLLVYVLGSKPLHTKAGKTSRPTLEPPRESPSPEPGPRG